MNGRKREIAKTKSKHNNNEDVEEIGWEELEEGIKIIEIRKTNWSNNIDKLYTKIIELGIRRRENNLKKSK